MITKYQPNIARNAIFAGIIASIFANSYVPETFFKIWSPQKLLPENVALAVYDN